MALSEIALAAGLQDEPRGLASISPNCIFSDWISLYGFPREGLEAIVKAMFWFAASSLSGVLLSLDAR
jgi:hypothetical protein